MGGGGGSWKKFIINGCVRHKGGGVGVDLKMEGNPFQRYLAKLSTFDPSSFTFLGFFGINTYEWMNYIMVCLYFEF